VDGECEAGGPGPAPGRPEGAAAPAQAGPALADPWVLHPVPARNPNHIWAYDFITDRTHDGRAFRLLTIVDEFTRECLAIVVARKLTADDVLATLTDLFITRGCPGHLRSDNGPEFCAKIVREWLAWLEVRTLFIKPGSPWGNGYSESFNEKLRDELLDREIFYIHAAGGPGLDQGLAAALQHRATHSALGYRPPAPDARSWSKLAMSPRSELELLTPRN